MSNSMNSCECTGINEKSFQLCAVVKPIVFLPQHAIIYELYFFNQTPQLLFLQSDPTATISSIRLHATISSIRLHGYYFFNQTP